MIQQFHRQLPTPTLFENLLLNNSRILLLFLAILIPFISGFNIYCALSGRTLASGTLSIQLLLFIIFLFIFKPPSTQTDQILAIRYVIRIQLSIFALYMFYVVGVLHQYEVAPWSFLFIFLLFLSFQDKWGGLFAFGYLIILCGIMIYSDIDALIDLKEYWIRHYFSLSLFSLLNYCSLIVRNLYLNNLSKTKTELEASEQKYRKLNKTLLTQIKERDAIEKKLHKAIKMETLGNVAAGVAHDLNNILSGIATYPDLLLMKMSKTDPNRKQTEMIRDSGFKAAAIVEDLLTLTRRGVYISEVTDLKQVIQNYLASPEHKAFLKMHPKIKIHSHLSDQTMNIIGSPVHLSKVIMNLVLNAAEAMPDGGNILIRTQTIKMKKQKLIFDTLPQDCYTILSVKDNGIGIPTENIENIFEPFFSTKKMGRSGTGLGMAIVLGTVKDHHAYIDIKSNANKGTCIYLFFKTTSDPKRIKGELNDFEQIKGNNEKILVIDDVPEQRFIATQILEELGYKAYSCASGEEAVLLVRESTYDLLIIDMIMDPGMDGMQTYQKILAFSKDQKAIIATGFSTDNKIEQAQALGAGSCLSKPYSLREMGLTIKKELSD